MKTRNILLSLLVFLGLGALYGGGVLIASPGGEFFDMPLSMLDHSPFNSFLIPGIILFTVLGIAPIGVTIALIKKPVYKLADIFNIYKDMHWAWTFCIYIAFALIIWIQVQMTILRTVHWAHSLYMALAMVILFMALLPQVRSIYKKPPEI